jgi:glycosyltransferase involved in cell wall biosynthesis
MPDFYGALDLVAHPAMEEPFGLAVVEAMASGRPIVAIAGGGVPEIIRADVDGLLVPAEQPAAMAEAILRLHDDPVLAERLTRSARQRVLDRFTPEIQARAMEAVYTTVAARRQTRAA